MFNDVFFVTNKNPYFMPAKNNPISLINRLVLISKQPRKRVKVFAAADKLNYSLSPSLRLFPRKVPKPLVFGLG